MPIANFHFEMEQIAILEGQGARVGVRVGLGVRAMVRVRVRVKVRG